ncbi:helix-turn-helix transcriptional regulator [Sphingomonas daechungensis]|uniref:Helix-turn-helix transcriptional regulator n=2 Tax=Sphingomonas daechungensis TaxID=1176646 RepID=A0ABX6T0W6_9SPHN|nr:helix-turn-helix transcriptional regulator [Sphingomonas daechungensis]QNP43477.1 helix-turn-helix transcriptional regulator [Sphingomonas daechungensis]
MTQRQLAELAGTSQQQIQRIESGFQAAKVDLARKLAHALQAPIRELFPASQTVQVPEEVAPLDKRAIALAKAGIDIDPRHYRLDVRMRGGFARDFNISLKDRARLQSVLKNRLDYYFVVFDTPTERVALNLREMSFCQFLYDVGAPVSEGVESAEDEEPLKVWLTDSTEPLTFDVEPDQVDDEDDDQAGEADNLSDIFHYLEMYDGADDDSFLSQVSFVDADGEEVLILNSHIALCTVPLEYVSAAFRRSKWEGEDEDEQLPEDVLLQS